MLRGGLRGRFSRFLGDMRSVTGWWSVLFWGRGIGGGGRGVHALRCGWGFDGEGMVVLAISSPVMASAAFGEVILRR